MKKLAIIILSLILITGCSNSTKESDNMYKKVNGNEVDALVDDGAVLIDVRTIEEYNEGHIDNAVNIPVDDILNGKINYDKDKTIIVYCRSGARSKTAADQLIELGYKNIYDLGSINNYK